MNNKKALMLLCCFALILAAACQSEKAAPEPPRPAPGSLLSIEGADNVRDLGGYRAAQGKTVRWDKVLRAGELNKLSPADVSLFEGLGLKTIVDFRGESEKVEAPDVPIATVQNTIYLPIDVGDLLDIRNFVRAPLEQNALILVDGNSHFVTDYQDQYREFFRILMNDANLPLLFHCTAGKDRAGFAAALFLSSLGVDRETIIADYQLSGEYVKEKYASYVQRMPNLAPIFETRREYISAAFETIDSQYGGIDNYLTKDLGVDLKKMRAIYTK
jgi:protein-tyrosine phosphatase